MFRSNKKKTSLQKKWYRFYRNTLERIISIYQFLREKRTVKDTWRSISIYLENDKKNKNWFLENQGNIYEGLIFLGIYICIFSALRMDWFLREIIPIGGDVPYHFANYTDLKEILLPNLQISGWSDAGFGGFQLFQGYPIFPFLLIYFLDLFIGAGVAFKTVMILGAVGLPIAIYWALIQARVPRPGPIFGTILSLAYLFHNDHFAFGGNLRSVFSGEFAHSLSILFLVLFCGFLFRAFENKKYIPHAIVLGALIGFTHPVTFAVAIFLPLGFLIGKQETSLGSRGKIALRIMLITGLLFSTWAIGYYVNHIYGIRGNSIVENIVGVFRVLTRGYGWSINLYHLLPKMLIPFIVICFIGVLYMIFSIKEKSHVHKVFLWGICIALIFFLMKFMNFAVRFLPILYLFIILFLATITGLIYKNTRACIKVAILICITLSMSFIYFFISKNNLINQYYGTSGYNFMGAESKNDWESIQSIGQYLSSNFDAQTQDNAISSPPRIFSYPPHSDILRIISKANMYNGLFGDSQFAKLGKKITDRINKKRIDAKRFRDYMELNNTKIIIIPNNQLSYILQEPYFGLIKAYKDFTLLETKNTENKYIVPLKNKVYSISDINLWQRMIYKWFDNYTPDSPFLVYDGNNEQDVFIPYISEKKIIKIPYHKNCTIQEKVKRETIRIHTDCINRPVLIKFSFHKNWKVIGADKIYPASPDFMIIIPKQSDVTLYYGKKLYNYIAYICGVLGIILFFTYGYIERGIEKTCVFSKRTQKNTKIRKMVEKIENIIVISSTPALYILVCLLWIAFIMKII